MAYPSAKAIACSSGSSTARTALANSSCMCTSGSGAPYYAPARSGAYACMLVDSRCARARHYIASSAGPHDIELLIAALLDMWSWYGAVRLDTLGRIPSVADSSHFFVGLYPAHQRRSAPVDHRQTSIMNIFTGFCVSKISDDKTKYAKLNKYVEMYHRGAMQFDD